MSPEEENQYFRRLLGLAPDELVTDHTHQALREAKKTIARNRPDRWEWMAIITPPIEEQVRLSIDFWEPYAATFNSDGKQVIWMKRRLG